MTSHNLLALVIITVSWGNISVLVLT